nr:MAG TPA_asm: hypothetical protein [Caudoviricetes sp.]
MAELFNSDLLNDVYFYPWRGRKRAGALHYGQLRFGKLKLEYVAHDMVTIVTHVSSPAGAEHVHQHAIHDRHGAVADVSHRFAHDQLAVCVIGQDDSVCVLYTGIERCLVKGLRIGEFCRSAGRFAKAQKLLGWRHGQQTPYINDFTPAHQTVIATCLDVKYEVIERVYPVLWRY